MSITQTPIPTGGEPTSTSGVVVRCTGCGRYLLTLQGAIKGVIIICPSCKATREWSKRRPKRD